MKIIPFDNGIYGAITYLVYDEKSKEGVIIDCTSYPKQLKEEIEKNNVNIKYILITHGHFDHVYCLNQIKTKFPNALIMMNKNDLSLLNTLETQCAMAGVENVNLPCIDGLLDENSQNLKIGEYSIKIIHTPGHSKGGMCYLIGDNLFSGDTLFRVSIGRCDLMGGSLQEIEKSIIEKLFELDENIKVYPGHGESTTIGYEKKYNPYFGLNYR
ncbi:MBL fold metallo-hydrolase [bacterium]|nr:MBL fold metallo-hydrolase [bacterium]